MYDIVLSPPAPVHGLPATSFGRLYHGFKQKVGRGRLGANMSKKVAAIILVHECDENPCHLTNEVQVDWIKQLLPLNKLEWNWKLHDVKVYDVKG